MRKNLREMQNENYQNTTTNEFCSSPENNDPKPENGIIRDAQYLSELHSFCDSIHREIDIQGYVESESQAVIAQQRDEQIYGHAQPQL